ncbi:regulatory protein RecX [Natranaerobius thermophilus]|uniref:Regulatory protein RecX n=1 Tax=Natranaerobius thermophilus (strain ATCC BAA-1301 / DSM 18059 / JW/NM-WN-LF) TaxID=457570 RepID=B2A3V5_NATTJ|nr:regulatory protein RecX [Natranaerobius thermophilus]ACB85057.1 regulatory protein RecX [Natranaerobius thermophilus JW/NM-WN-LF]
MCDENKHYEQALNQSFKYLSIRPRSQKEIFQYLMQKNYPRGTVEVVLNRLMELGYIDDEYFANSFAEEKVILSNNPIGPYKLKYELAKKGISGEIIDQVIAQYFEDEQSLAQLAFQKKYPQEDLEHDDLIKAAKYLERRGFSYEIIRSVVFS